MVVSGTPLEGKELNELKSFLKNMELEYDEGIEYSICILNDAYEIVATGSVDKNVLKCIAIEPSYQGQGLSAIVLSELIQYEFEKGRAHLFIYTKPQNLVMFSDMGFYTIFQTDNILLMENRKSGFEQFLKSIKEETPKEALEKGKEIGAVVANCNPFTQGHHFLLEKALKQCDYLHLFLLSDDRSVFSPKERYEMVKRGISGMERIILHWTSDYMISAATFPTYFFKDKVQGQRANCQLDLQLFAEKIAPQLYITKRFVGTEPNCSVTGMYNKQMKEVLPDYGIQVYEIERRTVEHTVISASSVRNYIAQNNLEKLKLMVPEKVYYYLKMNILK